MSEKYGEHGAVTCSRAFMTVLSFFNRCQLTKSLVQLICQVPQSCVTKVYQIAWKIETRIMRTYLNWRLTMLQGIYFQCFTRISDPPFSIV